ncbi:MAG: polyprenyl synthetase family protein [Acidobacteriota bacterium]|jgi:geranylgeranyl diphosphate synthase type II|nr:polyprenyl synthetase family protein [Acidobacteriota bacterium]
MDIKTYLADTRKIVDEYLEKLLPAADEVPATIHKAMRHSIFAGGKRLRPVLVLASGECLGGDRDALLHLGAAVEMMHTYSLIHDDLPALDNDDLRRGVPTCHKVFGEAMAILAGDALMTRCYQVLSELPGVTDKVRVQLVRELSYATGTVRGMIGGQVADIEAEGKPVDEATLEYIHHAKTGALLSACVRAGALAAGADEGKFETMTRFGAKLGLVFQIVDDILDVTSSSEALGKTVGKDEKAQKATYPALYGLEVSRQKAQALIDGALDDLRGFGSEAECLRGLARYFISRTT